jgi:hypothetical protein
LAGGNPFARVRHNLNAETPMTTKYKPTRKEADLFERAAARPQWEKLPQTTRTQLVQLLRQMLLSPPAGQVIQPMQKGAGHE